jgi:hypothetical protein
MRKWPHESRWSKQKLIISQKFSHYSWSDGAVDATMMAQLATDILVMACIASARAIGIGCAFTGTVVLVTLCVPKTQTRT